MKTIDLYHYEEDGNTVVYTRERLKEVGLDTDEKIAQAATVIGVEGHWDNIMLKDPVAAMERDIRHACRVPDKERGFVVDDAELPAARAVTAIESWTFAPTVTQAVYYSLNLKVAQVIDLLVVNHLYGGAMDDRFLSALNGKRETSEEGKASR